MEEIDEHRVAKRYNLGPLGWLLVLTPTSDQPGSQQGKGHLTIVLDVSGSMGPWVGYARRAAQAAAIQLGYDENDTFSFITFTGHSQRITVEGRDPTIGELTTRLNNINCQGSTNMAGAIPLLGDVLRNHQDSAHNILVISDGEVHDQDRTVRAATDMVNSLGERQAPISASLLRLKTSRGASPDTRALASVGSFCNQDKAAVTDVDVFDRNQEEVGVLNLTESIVTGFRDAPTGTFVELVSKEPMFRLPTGEGLYTVHLGCGSTTSLLVSNPVETVTIGGEVVTVEDAGPPDSEETLRTFFEFVEQQLKMWQLMGTRQGDIQKVVEWVGELQSFLDTIQTNATEDADLSTMARARGLAKAIKKRTGSIMDRIRQLGNADRVGQLNAQQQADWLRGIGNTRTGRGLARRAQRANEDMDYAGQAQTAVRLLSQQSFPPEESADRQAAPRSFYSLSDPFDCLESAQELAVVADDLAVGDVLTCVGGLGVPFEAFVGDFPDPFSLRVKRVYDGQFLAEPDVWLVRSQTGQSNATLTCPGRGEDAFITGVITLRSASPEAYSRLTTGDVRRLFEMQASSQIRHAVACVPYDAIALNAAGAWHFIQTLGFNRNLSTVQWENLRALLDNNQYLIGHVYKSAPFRELYDSMVENEDARPWLSGDREVSGILRPITVLLRFFEAPEDVNERVPWMPHVLRALFYLDCYHAAKKHFRREEDANARETLLRLTLGIDLESHATPVLPLFEPEPEEHQHYNEVTVDSLQIPQFFPRVGGLIGLECVLRNRLVTSDPISVFGVNPNTLRAVAAVQALRSPNQSDRIDTDNRVSLLPDPTTEDEAQAYLRDVVRGYYAEDYERRVAAKKREEERVTMMRAIDKLVTAESYAEFRRVLLECPIVNRQHEGFGLLMERLLAESDSPACMEKLSLLMTGRDVDRPEVEVWCNGNFYTGNWKSVAEVILKMEGGSDRMVLLRKLRKEYGIHRYRGGDGHVPNQHGHGNDFPSYWALGYKDLYDMRDSVPHEEFVTYLQAHCRDRGCCLPNEPQRADFGLK
jgi:hypothetical protein